MPAKEWSPPTPPLPPCAPSQLPEGAQLVLLKGYSRSEVLQLYRRAKVYIDSYLTGNERGVFESTLFNMVPIISRHGPALEWHDFPLSQVCVCGWVGGVGA